MKSTKRLIRVSLKTNVLKPYLNDVPKLNYYLAKIYYIYMYILLDLDYAYVDPYANAFADDYDERPLLEELEIYPLRIIEKSLAVLNPFHVGTEEEELLLDDPDLTGPVLFCMALASAMFLSGGESRFGYIYGLSVVAVSAMYFLVHMLGSTALDKNQTAISVTEVASILGYGMVPIVWLSVLGIMTSLHSWLGFVLAVGAVALTTYGTSAQFCRLTGNPFQRQLLAYPCAMIYSVFALVVVF